jgi:hypothetical protein
LGPLVLQGVNSRGHLQATLNRGGKDRSLREVAARLDPEKRYGLWWFNRRGVKVQQVSEPGPDGRRYRKTYRWHHKPKEEWVAVPVPDSGIPANSWKRREMWLKAIASPLVPDGGSGSLQAGLPTAAGAQKPCAPITARRPRKGASTPTTTTAAPSAIDTVPTFAPTPTGPERGSWRVRHGTSSLVS